LIVSTVFPKWTNALPTLLAGGGVATLALIVGTVWYTFTPKYWVVGYMPKQPGGGFNHQLHAGKLGLDCRYCHTNVETSPEANIPNVASCVGCHAEGRLAKLATSEDHKNKTQFVRDAYAADEPIEWRRIHKLPDYVRNFPHHAHVSAGVSCISCHGNIARLPEVWQYEPLSMGWCLECHRNPEPYLQPKDKLTRLFEIEDRQAQLGPAGLASEGAKFYEERKIHAPENCAACHY